MQSTSKIQSSWKWLRLIFSIIVTWGALYYYIIAVVHIDEHFHINVQHGVIRFFVSIVTMLTVIVFFEVLDKICGSVLENTFQNTINAVQQLRELREHANYHPQPHNSHVRGHLASPSRFSITRCTAFVFILFFIAIGDWPIPTLISIIIRNFFAATVAIAYYATPALLAVEALAWLISTYILRRYIPQHAER